MFPLPSWQNNVGVPPSANDGVSVGRGVPDIAADADPNTGYDIVADGQWVVVGGTSAVAPLYAGLLAVINANLNGMGFPNVGFVSPFLYTLGGTSAFADIVDGNNWVGIAAAYSAGTGWDACTGLGRINGNNLQAVL